MYYKEDVIESQTLKKAPRLVPDNGSFWFKATTDQRNEKRHFTLQ